MFLFVQEFEFLTSVFEPGSVQPFFVSWSASFQGTLQDPTTFEDCVISDGPKTEFLSWALWICHNCLWQLQLALHQAMIWCPHVSSFWLVNHQEFRESSSRRCQLVVKKEAQLKMRFPFDSQETAAFGCGDRWPQRQVENPAWMKVVTYTNWWLWFLIARKHKERIH